MPISRFVAVSLRPASSVLSRTLARTGRVVRLEAARPPTDRPRARFSCMTESLTSGSLHLLGTRGWAGSLLGDGRVGAEAWVRGGRPVGVRRGYLPSFL